MTLVVDTGDLYVAADTRDGDHQASRDLLETHAANDLVVPGPVITFRVADGTLAQHGSTLEGP